MKSANVFLYKDGSAKLGDFNVSKIAQKGLLFTQTGTPYYASPEVWKDMPYDQKSDIWSMGCTLYEMCCLKPPFRAENMQSLYKKVLKGVYHRIPDIYSYDLSAMLRVLLQVNAPLRPECTQIMQFRSVTKFMNEKHMLVPTEEEKTELLKTIYFPKNIHMLHENLPK